MKFKKNANHNLYKMKNTKCFPYIFIFNETVSSMALKCIDICVGIICQVLKYLMYYVGIQFILWTFDCNFYEQAFLLIQH